jgi:hypothetical protein
MFPDRDRRMRSQVPPTMICGMPEHKRQAMLRGNSERAGTASRERIESLACIWPLKTGMVAVPDDADTG